MINWEINNFTKGVLFIQLSFLGLKWLLLFGLEIPFLMQIIGFIYLFILPGFLILRIFRFNEFSIIEIILYTIGLSLIFLMFIGLLLNFLSPLIGITKPLSENNILFSITISLLLLIIINYIRNNNYSFYLNDNLKYSYKSMLLISLIMLSMIGTYMLNYYNNNYFILFMIIIISFFPIFISFNIIKKDLYALSIFVISISLILHRSLVSNYLWGWDIHIEYFLTNIVIKNFKWNYDIPHRMNAMVSVTILAPIISKICNIDIIYTFKIIYPLIFSLVPVGLYIIYKKQVNDQISFYSCYFFMSIFTFYSSLPQLARQQIAEFFLVLMILLILDKNMETRKRILLFTIFSLSLSISHYGLSIVYILSLILVWLTLFLIKKSYKIFLMNKSESKIFSLNYVALFCLFTLSWYIYVSNAVIFTYVVGLANLCAKNIFREFLNPMWSEGLNLIITKFDFLRAILKNLHLISQLLIVIGFFSILLKNKKIKFLTEYILFSLVDLSILFAVIIIPYFGRSMNTTRFYHITLFFLSPFCVIGGITVFQFFNRLFRMPWTIKSSKKSMKLFSIFFTIFLLFNSGFVNELAKGVPISISLNNNMDYPRFNTKEVHGASWISEKTEISHIYGDLFGFHLLNEYMFGRVGVFDNNTEEIPYNSYVYFRGLNVKGKIKSYPRSEIYIPLKEYKFFNNIIIKMNKLYDNGGSHIYH